MYEFKAAGVLPLHILQSGDVLVLLGAEDTRTGPLGKMRKNRCKSVLSSHATLHAITLWFLAPSMLRWIHTYAATVFLCFWVDACGYIASG